ncbi:MAG: single-stranded DNA-binding protein [Synechococcales cyanobacterium K44_A2020_017]|jgi:single-stranded DNA-binding protein|nr:single-stranded DNA-binding protein [Synechococcales cyanobacterium K32_A2020_035]MBF2094493.1 single-stranded DNA-binding protein [Synechococcales cyanobacterium K44_A2020_017]
MNNFILMAEIVKDPELRYTPDGQTAIAELVVQFPGLRDNDPMETIKAVGWGNLAQSIQAQYHQGDRVVLEGRLGMNTVERPEGFKEKLAEMTIQRIYPLGADTLLTTSIQTGSDTSSSSSAPPPAPRPVAAPPVAHTAPAPYAPPAAPPAPAYQPPAYQPPADPEPNYDDIPF